MKNPPNLPRRLAVVGTAALLLISTIALGGPAQAATPTVTIDYSKTIRSADHVGEGFLYGLSQDGTAPADNLVKPLQINLVRGGGARIAGHGWIGDGYRAGSGYQARISSAIAQAKRAAALGSEYVLMFNDLWGADTDQPSNSVYPCDSGDCSNWVTFIKQVYADVTAAGVKVTWEPWNEPDNQPFWPRGMNTTQYFQMWDTAFKTIRGLNSSARIEGPAIFIPNQSVIDTFLAHTSSAGTTPNVLSAHNLVDEDPVTIGSTFRTELAKYSITGVTTSLNEYLDTDQLNPGGTAWYLGRLTKSGVTTAARGVYPQQYAGQAPCCMAADLSGVLLPSSNSVRTTGQWWTYRAFADLNGSYVSATTNGAVEGTASANTSGRNSVILLGGKPGGQSAYTGQVNLALNNITGQSWAAAGSSLRVKVVRIPDRAPLTQPVVISNTTVTAASSITVTASLPEANDALAVYITPAASSDATYVDSSTTSGTNRFTFGSTWKTPTGIDDLYAGTALTPVAASQPTSATFTFTGTGVELHGVKDVDQGIATYSIDGGTATTVDGYASSRDSQATLYSAKGLTRGTHTVTISTTGTKSSASSSTIVALDYALVTP